MKNTLLIIVSTSLILLAILLILMLKKPQMLINSVMWPDVELVEYGIDVSHHQGYIDWSRVRTANGKHEISFIYIKATEGCTFKDKRFETNWNQAKKHGFKVGAYHFYNPNINSTQQAQWFIRHVALAENDMPPVLDIEKLPRVQSMTSLKKGIRNWLKLVEQHYGKKPIIYASASYYSKYLAADFSKYPLWVANFNQVKNPTHHAWDIWQFTDKGSVRGISGRVDVNGIHPESILQELASND